MKIKPEHPNFEIPVRSTAGSGGYDIFMPEAGRYLGEGKGEDSVIVSLGFSLEVPLGHVALLVPRSGIGFKRGLEVNNTVGVIDSDYRDTVFASIRTKNGQPLSWEAGDRLIQMLIVPITTPAIEIVNDLNITDRKGGLGSTGV